MTEFLSMQEVIEATDYVKQRLNAPVDIGLILGSGLGELADAIEDAVVIPTGEIPGWPVSTVPGHKGRLVIGTLEGKRVMALQGRTHYYEGHSISKTGLPVRVMQSLGVKTLILTNASGGLNEAFETGDLMLMNDHIGFLGMAGENPLRGPNLDEFGPRFPAMSSPYDPQLIALAQKVGGEIGLKLQQGVYVWLAGPSFETPAECRFMKMVGADAVGMSTVPETIVARHGGMRVLAIATITNKIDPDGTNKASHEEVLQAGDQIAPNLMRLLRGVLRQI